MDLDTSTLSCFSSSPAPLLPRITPQRSGPTRNHCDMDISFYLSAYAAEVIIFLSQIFARSKAPKKCLACSTHCLIYSKVWKIQKTQGQTTASHGRKGAAFTANKEQEIKSRKNKQAKDILPRQQRQQPETDYRVPQ